jgi:tetratricopeptide (TPR) repeat protein
MAQNPNSEARRLQLARDALASGRIGDAETAVRGVLSLNDQNGEAVHLLGVIALQTGQTTAAAQHFRDSIIINPANAESHMNLGIALNMLGRRDEGLASLELAAEIKPTNGQAHYNLAMAELDNGNVDKALERMERAVRLEPKSTNMHTSLGGMLLQKGETEAGLKHFRRAVALSPNSAVVHNNLGGAVQHIGDHEGAVAHFRKAQELDPEDSDSALNIANSFSAQRKTDEAIHIYEEVIEQTPDSIGGYNNYGLALRYQGRFPESVIALERALELAKPDARITSNLAETLFQSGRGRDALAVLLTHMKQAPDDGTANQIGQTLVGLGDFDGAVDVYISALVNNPQNLIALSGLVDIGDYELTDEQQATLKSVASDDGPANEKIRAALALARWHDRQGRAADAALLMQSVAEIRRPIQPFDLESYNTKIAKIIDTFDVDFFSNRTEFGIHSDVPILVVGAPRSGTALVEQIIGAHPDVHGAGELMDFFRLVQQLPHMIEAGSEFPGCVTKLDAERAGSLAKTLESHRQELAPSAKRIVDKSASYSEVLGVVKMTLPKTHVVYVTRDPMDQCLSLYFHDLTAKFPYASDLGALGGHAKAFAQVMDHWKSVMDIHTVAYEDLVADPAVAARGIIESCGLSWDPRCLDFQSSEGVVVSATPWRVRQQVDTRSVGRWKKYEALLGPLKDALD